MARAKRVPASMRLSASTRTVQTMDGGDTASLPMSKRFGFGIPRALQELAAAQAALSGHASTVFAHPFLPRLLLPFVSVRDDAGSLNDDDIDNPSTALL
ncbi:MAG: hypothetical protein F4107_06865 [Gemmatimonadetes bacterium]|nr:hypothetical protein [Gemmatimonadota bacterium]